MYPKNRLAAEKRKRSWDGRRKHQPRKGGRGQQNIGDNFLEATCTRKKNEDYRTKVDQKNKETKSRMLGEPMERKPFKKRAAVLGNS